MRQRITSTVQLGQRLRGERKTRRISQVEMGKRLGISQGRYSILEGDPAAMPLERLLALLEQLGLELVVQDPEGP